MNRQELDNSRELNNFIGLFGQCLDEQLKFNDLISNELVGKIKDHLNRQCLELQRHLIPKNYEEYLDSLEIENTLLEIAITKKQIDKARDVVLIILDSLKLVLDEGGGIIVRGVQEIFEILKVMNQKDH